MTHLLKEQAQMTGETAAWVNELMRVLFLHRQHVISNFLRDAIEGILEDNRIRGVVKSLLI